MLKLDLVFSDEQNENVYLILCGLTLNIQRVFRMFILKKKGIK